MTPQEYERLTELFHSALEIAPDERGAFLDQVSGSDPDLRRELESLLSAQEMVLTEKPPDDIAAGYLVQQGDDSANVPSVALNSRLDHYEICLLLGKGGMGEVYLAEDVRLHRNVALKILPAAVASNQDRMRRFEQEAQAAAALNHPNIAHIYEIGESEGTHFIAIEYIDGDTLRDKIHCEKVPLTKLLEYLTQVAEGLSKAHAAGIVHRDLKPDNIMITRDDYAKILDFGLAKLVEPGLGAGYRPGEVAGSSPPLNSGDNAPSSEIATTIMQSHSTPGMVMGTIGYMSPEQASGRVNEIDHRSDIFSFGCILFEAATGQKAFEGKDALDSLHRIVHAPTPQLKGANALAPEHLQRVVRRCLAKEPERRYQSIKDVAIELEGVRHELARGADLDYPRAITSRSVATSTNTGGDEGFWVAVLPFKYRGSHVDLEVLAEGLSEDIVTGLSRFSCLRVIARSSTLRYRSEAADVRAVGRELGARYVMEGSLRQEGSTLRVAVQLVDATTGSHLWAETYSRAFNSDQVFALQDDLVPCIVSTIADNYGVLPHSISETLRSKDPKELTPYEAVLRSFGYYERINPEAHAETRAILEQALEKAPQHPNCLAMVSSIYADEHKFGYNLRPDPLGRALSAARRAIEFAPSNAFAHTSLAQALFFRRELEAFRNAAEHAISLNPLDAVATAWLGTLMAYAGNWGHGCKMVERARQQNPHHPGWYWFADFYRAYLEGDYRAALNVAVKVNMPGHFYQHIACAAAYGQLGEHEAAERALRDLLALQPDFALIARDQLGKWYLPGLVGHLIDGLRKAGLDIAEP